MKKMIIGLVVGSVLVALFVSCAKKENISITKTESGRERIELKDLDFKLEAGSIRPGNKTDEYLIEGNVEVSGKNGATGRADEALLNIKDGKVILKGNARFKMKSCVIEGKEVSNPTTFTGETIVLRLNPQTEPERARIELEDLKIEAGSIRKGTNPDEYIAEGNATLYDKKSGVTSTSDEILFKLKDGKIILQGYGNYR